MAEQTFRLPQKAYRRQLLKVFANSKKTAKEFGEQQARLWLKEVVVLQPPGGKTSGTSAKKTGEGAVVGDLRNLFIPVPPSQAERHDLAVMHKQARTTRGRVRKTPARRWRVASAALTAYISIKKRNVGFLAAGLNQASGRFGYKPPAWIWRHRAPGAVEIKVSSNGFRIKMTNAVSFASNVRGLERRFQFALDKRTRALKNLAGDYAKKLKRGTIFR